MPNTFEEQAKARFHKSQAFMQKAATLLQDDLVYRSALADAVSSIKNMLQGYLLLRVARTPESAVTQRWQEVAVSNRMPDLIQACGEAGLDLRGLAVEIKRLNNERNYRAHDDPLRLVDPDQAEHALDLAQTVQKRIRVALQGGSAADTALPAAPLANRRATTASDAARQAPAAQQTASEMLAPLDNEPASHDHASARANGRAPQDITPATSPAQGGSAAGAIAQPGEDNASSNIQTTPAIEPQEDDDSLSPDDTAISLPGVTRRRARFGLALQQALIAAMLVIAGVAAGAGLTLPVATGHTPEWLSFATQFLTTGATPTPTPPPIPTATPSPTTSPLTIGALTVQIAPCQAGITTLTLQNTGSAPLRWALGSPDTQAATFTIGNGAAGAPAQFGTLAARASVAIAASAPGAGNTYRVVVVAPQGTVQLLLAAC